MPTGADPETVYENPADGWGCQKLVQQSAGH